MTTISFTFDCTCELCHSSLRQSWKTITTTPFGYFSSCKVDGIVHPVDTVFDEPVGKVDWLSGYINECLEAKTHAEEEVGKVKEDAMYF